MNKYEITKEIISENVSGCSRIIIHKESGKPRVFKTIWKRIYTAEEKDFIMQNIQVLKRLDHPNIVKIHEFYTDKKNFYLITEYVKGETLQNYFLKFDGVTERKASIIARQLIGGLLFCS